MEMLQVFAAVIIIITVTIGYIWVRNPKIYFIKSKCLFTKLESLFEGCSNFFVKVEKDVESSKNYRRAILENRGDGEILSMYGKLIWETKRDEKKGQGHFDQAVNTSPVDW